MSMIVKILNRESVVSKKPIVPKDKRCASEEEGTEIGLGFSFENILTQAKYTVLI